MTDAALTALAQTIGGILILLGVVYTARSGKAASSGDRIERFVISVLSDNADLRSRVEKLEQRDTNNATWRRLAISYINRLIDTHPNPERPPRGLDLD